jgi:rubrerythrin
MSKTMEDLKAAFAGESQANRRYISYAKKAEEEGCMQIAKLFRAIAAAEAVHAANHLKAMGGILGTGDNILESIKGEHYEVVSMYPPFIQDAEEDGNKKALTSFRWAMEVEKIHEQLYQQALDTMDSEPSAEDYYVCPICGYTHTGMLPERCPVCSTPGARFELID